MQTWLLDNSTTSTSIQDATNVPGVTAANLRQFSWSIFFNNSSVASASDQSPTSSGWNVTRSGGTLTVTAPDTHNHAASYAVVYQDNYRIVNSGGRRYVYSDTYGNLSVGYMGSVATPVRSIWDVTFTVNAYYVSGPGDVVAPATYNSLIELQFDFGDGSPIQGVPVSNVQYNVRTNAFGQFYDSGVPSLDVTHTFSGPNSSTGVKFRAASPSGRTSDWFISDPIPIAASFTATPDDSNPELIHFDASGSSYIDGPVPIEAYSWQFIAPQNPPSQVVPDAGHTGSLFVQGNGPSATFFYQIGSTNSGVAGYPNISFLYGTEGDMQVCVTVLRRSQSNTICQTVPVGGSTAMGALPHPSGALFLPGATSGNSTAIVRFTEGAAPVTLGSVPLKSVFLMQHDGTIYAGGVPAIGGGALYGSDDQGVTFNVLSQAFPASYKAIAWCELWGGGFGALATLGTGLYTARSLDGATWTAPLLVYTAPSGTPKGSLRQMTVSGESHIYITDTQTYSIRNDDMLASAGVRLY